MNEFITVLKNETAEITEKKSRFIADIIYVESIKQVEENINSLKKKYYGSRHNCIAYRIIENGQVIERASDDGEPSGTAGAPMLTILQKNNLCNILVVVTRYFGGILLGTGGLVRAYSEATQKAIEKCELCTKINGEEIFVKLDYSSFEKFKYYCKNKNITINEINYLSDIELKCEMEISAKAQFLRDIETKALNIKEYRPLETKYITKK